MSQVPKPGQIGGTGYSARTGNEAFEFNSDQLRIRSALSSSVVVNSLLPPRRHPRKPA